MDSNELVTKLTHFKFSVPFPPSANGAYPDVTKFKNGKPYKKRVLSKRMVNWLKSCPRIIDQSIKVYEPVVVKYDMYFPDDCIRDGQSYLKPLLDYIVKQNIICDDNRRIVKGERWRDCGIDREAPRVEVTIESIGQSYGAE